jgi:FtsH-binding integral membrane protein
MSKETHMLPVWFFIGVLLAIYGVIILVMAVVDFNQTSQAVLAEYHPGLFGGVLLILLGGLYTFWFWPGRRKKN